MNMNMNMNTNANNNINMNNSPNKLENHQNISFQREVQDESLSKSFDFSKKKFNNTRISQKTQYYSEEMRVLL